jgi:carbon-monoxide dehydrogenase medium subunit
MYDFVYERPATLEEAVRLAQADDAKILAGGMTLIPTCKQRLAQPGSIVDLGGLSDLAGIVIGEDSIRIGGMTRHADVARHAELQRLIPALAYLAGSIGDAQVRNRGTIGGSLANNDPSADYPVSVLGLGATIHTDRRSIGADDYFVGMFETALEPGEIIAGVTFPIPEKAGYAKFRNPASRYAIIGVWVSKGPEGVRVAVTGAGYGVFRVTEMEEALAASWSVDAVRPITVSPDNCSSDMHASGEYRAHLINVMAQRAVEGTL